MTDMLEHDDDLVEAEIVEETYEEELARKRSAYIADLRRLADFLEQRPERISNHEASYGGVRVNMYALDAEDLAKQLKVLGSFDKVDSDYEAGGEVSFGRHKVRVTASKSATCKKVETGETKTVTKTADASATIPDGARNVRTVTSVVYEVDEPETTWECGSLLNPTKDEAEAA